MPLLRRFRAAADTSMMIPALQRQLGRRDHDAGSPSASADRELMAQCGVWLFGGGATLGLVSLLFFELEPSANRLGLFASVGGGYLVAAIILVGYERLPRWTYQALLLAGTAMVSIGLYFSGDPRNDNEMFYLLVSIYVCYFFSLRQAALQLVVVGSAYATVLAVVDGAGRAAPARWLVAMGTVIVAGITVRLLKQRVQRLVDRLADAARSDALTGLLNRRGFGEAFDIELERARRTGRPLNVLICDLDHFKSVNDRCGHAAGDSALQQFSHLLTETARAADTVARIGGEEFALLIPDTDPAGASILAERLRHAVATTFADAPAPLTVSVGMAIYPQNATTIDGLLSAADQALYAAKGTGRNRCAIHGQDVTKDRAGRGEALVEREPAHL